jgi:hypothetical protein
VGDQQERRVGVERSRAQPADHHGDDVHVDDGAAGAVLVERGEESLGVRQPLLEQVADRRASAASSSTV